VFAGLDRATRWVVALGVVARGALLTLGAERLDRAFVVDDAYYTLTIARELAHHGKPTVDGAELTSGFQPLLALLELPAFVLRASADTGLMWGLFVLFVADAAIALLLARVATRIAGPRAGLLAAAGWALSAIALREASVGLEAPLATAVSLAAALALDAFAERPTRRREVLAGLLLGACLLARIDTVFFVAAAGVWLLLRHRRSLLVIGAAASLVAGPWLIFCAVLTGRPFPESGSAVRALIGLDSSATTFARTAGWASGYFVSGGFADLPELRNWFIEHPYVGALTCLAALGAAVFVSVRAPIALRIWLLAAFGLVVFYVFALPAIWGFHRYLLPVRAAATIVLALALDGVAARLPQPARRVAGGALFAALTIQMTLVTLAALTAPARGGIDGTTGYRAVALAIHAGLPPNSTVGALQSGALGYFAPPHIRVVNLDGVVSRSAHRAYVERRMDEHLRARGATHVADWFSSLQELRARSRRPPILVREFAAPWQGKVRMAVYRIERE